MSKIFYTDGACSGNPGPGGWASISLDDNSITYNHYDFEENTTNNAMELKAILDVFEYIYTCEKNNFTKERYVIISDSAYAINSITNWMEGWANNNWRNSKGKIIENIDIIKLLYDYYITKNLKCQIEFEKIHGHCGILGNELADAIASKNKSKYLNLISKNNLIDF